MNDHCGWLKEQKDEARSVLEEILIRFKEVEKELENARKALSVWTEAHNLAMIQAGLPIEEEERVSKLKKPKKTIPNLAEEAIKERGPLDSKKLQEILEERGKRTTVNSITVSLNKERPERFDRNDEGKWCLVAQEESDPEGDSSEVA